MKGAIRIIKIRVLTLGGTLMHTNEEQERALPKRKDVLK